MHSTKPESYHNHQCGHCGYVWQHPNRCHGHSPSHYCPKCGNDHWQNAFRVPELEPQVCFLGLHNPPKPTTVLPAVPENDEDEDEGFSWGYPRQRLASDLLVEALARILIGDK